MKKKQRKPVILFTVICIIFALILSGLLYTETRPQQKQDFSFSLVAYGTTLERWNALE